MSELHGMVVATCGICVSYAVCMGSGRGFQGRVKILRVVYNLQATGGHEQPVNKLLSNQEQRTR